MIFFRRSEEMTLSELIMSDLKKDLHIHTCYSDGTLTPEEVVDRWIAEGYELIAIADHDGIEGSVIGMDYAAGRNIKFISGIEFDSEDPLARNMHILGYGFDYHNLQLRTALFDIIMKRARRNDALMKVLNDMGYGITLDDIGEINEGRYIGKPTFARILERKGILENQQDAFKSIFREPEIRAVAKETYSTRSVIELIHASGGLAFFAHPMEQRKPDEEFEDFRPRLVRLLETVRDYGIDGIECYHPSASEMQSEFLREFAEKNGLLISRGSDFHTDVHPRDYTVYHKP